MAATLEPLTLTCPIRGVLKPKKKKGADLSNLEERHRIDAIRYLLALGYPAQKVKIEAVVAKFGHGGKNSFRCDLAVLDVDATLIDMTGPNGVAEMLQHAVILVEVKRDDSKADYVQQTQVEPLLKFATQKSTLGLYWDGVTPRVFWKEDDGKQTTIHSGPLALLPKPGKSIKAKPLVHSDLRPPESLLDVFSRVEDVLHGASVPLEDHLLDACVSFCSETHATQMRALARGSDGLAEIHEEDLGFILVPIIEDKAERLMFEPLVQALINGATTLKGTVSAMLSQGTLAFPVPQARPHHSALV